MKFAGINGHRKKSHRSRSEALRVIVHDCAWLGSPDLLSRRVMHMTMQWLPSGIGLKPAAVPQLVCRIWR
jgi:hypothetical protein